MFCMERDRRFRRVDGEYAYHRAFLAASSRARSSASRFFFNCSAAFASSARSLASSLARSIVVSLELEGISFYGGNFYFPACDTYIPRSRSDRHARPRGLGLKREVL